MALFVEEWIPVSAPEDLHRRTSGRVRACGQILSPFAVATGVGQSTTSTFLFNSVIEDDLQNALSGLSDEATKFNGCETWKF